MANSTGAVVGTMSGKESWGAMGTPLPWVALNGRAAAMVEVEAGEGIFTACAVPVRSWLVWGGSHRELGRPLLTVGKGGLGMERGRSCGRCPAWGGAMVCCRLKPWLGLFWEGGYVGISRS